MVETVAVCPTKNEGPYLLEWIAYYRAIGFDRILVATHDNTDCTPALLAALARRYDWFDHVEHSVTSEDAIPLTVSHGLARDRLRETGFEGFAGVFDADEFLYLYTDRSIAEFIARFDGVDSIGVNWRIFGSAGHLTRPPGLVIESYPTCAEEAFKEHIEFKSLFRVDERLARFNSHYPRYRDPRKRRYVFTDGESMDERVRTEKPYHLHARTCFRGCQLNHYAIKSRDEFALRQARGRGGQSAKISAALPRYTAKYFADMDRNEVFSPVRPELVARVEEAMRAIYADCRLHEVAPPEHFGLPPRSSTSETGERAEALRRP